ncbi:hypothetical protein C8R44DRAFT_853086 [Mycena epipterygia]|nr:hypothetical protein C8R44DRAFT_853086 [Mycena epipterygia]
MAGSIFQILALVAFATRFAVAAPAPAPVLVTILDPIASGAQTESLTATIEGVDSQGRTTYAFGKGPDVATFVEGSDYFSFVVADAIETAIVGGECELQGSNAVCTVVEGDSPIATTTLQAFPFVFDIAATAAPGGGTAPASAPTNKPNSSQRTSTSVFGALVGVSLAYYLI